MKAKSGFPKRLFATVLSAVMALTTVPVIGIETAQAAVNTLTGVSETHWARNSIEKMVNQNILSGDKDGNLHPDRPVTRAEYVAMINRAFGYTDHSGKKLPFQDIKGTEWYADHIRVAYEQGYFSGIDKSTAGATNPITREEAAALICRNLKLDSKTLQIDKFADGKTVSQWSRPAVGAAVEKGFIHGYTDGSFRPKALISRAEAATMFSNAMGTIYDRSGTYGQGMIEGNVTISSSNLTLSDMVITGDLYITEGVGTGYVNLKNVSVLGEVIVCGGGEGNFGGNSVTLDDCTIWKLTVDGSDERPVSLYAKGNTNIPETNIKSIAYLQNHPDIEVGFDNIEVKGPEDTTLYLSGTFQNVAAMNPKNKVVLGKGKVENLTVDEDAKDAEVTLDRNVVVENMNLDGNGKVTGRGDIENLIVTTEDTSVESLPDQIEIRPGVTSNIAGKEMTSLDGAESSSDPKILSGYPHAEEITSAAAKVYFKTNKPGTIRWALTYDDADELDEDEILKPTTIARIQKYGAMSVSESDKEVNLALSGLEANATYVLYAVLTDERNDVSRIKEEEIETADKTEPGFVNGYPRVVPETSTSFSIEAMLTKNGSIYWAVYKKGAAAPTAYQLRSQNLDGTLCHGVKKNAEKNIEYDDMLAMHESMTDKETYDVYIMTSDGEKDSKIVKLNAKTKDTTPPEYKPDPRPDKNEERSVSVTLGANEEATAYYVVIPWGETFPKPVPGTDGKPGKQPELNEEEARRQVLNGNNVLKAGKMNVRADAETTIKISGLEKETPYHVFIVLQDKAGNYSTWVKKVDVKTRDVNAPKAKVDFENSIDGKADVEENIMIVFDEIVCYLTPGSLLKDLEVKENDPEKDKKVEMLAEIFKLTDVSSVNEEDVDIAYEHITFEEGEKGATIVVFPPEAFINEDGDPGLNSGASYKFTLNNLSDTTGNLIPKDYKLDIFQTAPPLIILTQTSNPFDLEYRVVDYAFSIQPEARNTADRVLFDIIFQTDTKIGFELYQWDPEATPPVGSQYSKEGDWVPLNIVNTTTETGEQYALNGSALEANEGITLHQILDWDAKPPAKDKQLTFEKFNTLPHDPNGTDIDTKTREYAVRITRINNDTEREGWDAVIKMDVKCVAGEFSELESIARNPVANYAGALSGGKVSMVNYSTQNLKNPMEFIMQMSFADTIVPEFVKNLQDELCPVLTNPDPDVEPNAPQRVGDVYIQPDLVTNRKATMYYIIVPKGAIQVDTKDEAALNNMAHDIMANGYQGEGRFWGTYEINSGYSLNQPRLPQDGELQPDGEEYDFFCVLKGTPAAPSKVYYRTFKTEQTSPPKLDIELLDKTSTDATLIITSDKNAYVEWIVLSRSYAMQMGYINPDNTKKATDDALKNLIRKGASGTNKEQYLDSSKEMVKWDAYDDRYELEETVKLTSDAAKNGERYIMLAFGQLRLSDGTAIGNDPKYESAVAVSPVFERRDTTAPKIDDPGNTGLLQPPKFDAGCTSDIGGKYSGSVDIMFTEGLFYRKNDGIVMELPDPVNNPTEFLKTFFISTGHPFQNEKSDSTDKIVWDAALVDEEILKPDGSGLETKKGVLSVRLRFEECQSCTVRLNPALCDAEGNYIAPYYLKFVDMEDTPQPNENFDSTKPESVNAAMAARRAKSYWGYGIGESTQ